MFQSFSLLDPGQKIFWIVAIAATLVFIIQTLLTFLGLGGDADVDMDFSTDGMDGDFSGLFSFRNLINFLLGYGWSGALLYGQIEAMWVLQLVSIGVGLVFVALFLILFKQMMRLSHDGSFHIEEAVGLTAQVYLRIPAQRSSKGKVQVSVKGSVHELDAVTDSNVEIATGGTVKITEALTDDLLLVERI